MTQTTKSNTSSTSVASQTVPLPVSLTEDDHLQFKKDFEPHIEQSIEKRLKRFAVWFGTSILLVIIGAVLATIWQLNGAIYEAVGKSSERELYSEVLKMKIQQLDKENQLQKKALDCYANPTIKDKRGCNYGH
jgi:hypothetical protein